ncbi:MAG: hypothetical protein AAF566_13240 [Pseudomonadota bacterium]
METQKLTSKELEKQIATINEQIGCLKVERRDAVIDDKDFDQSKLRDAKDRRDAFQAALDELYRREQEAARIAALEAAQRSEAEAWALELDQITKLRQARRASILAMEAAFRQAMANYTKAEQARADLVAALRAATGQTVLQIHDAKTMQADLMERMDTLIKSTIGGNWFGEHETKPGMFMDPDHPWHDEASGAEREIDRLIEDRTAVIPDAA